MGKWIVQPVVYLIDCFTSLLYSSDLKCVLCGEELYEERYLCKKCENNINDCKNYSYVVKNNIRIKFYSVAYYSRTMKEMIIKLKYRKDFLCGEALGDLMYKFILKNNITFDEIVFIPMIREDLKVRGYNQSKLLAVEISKKVNLPVKNYLKKAKKTSDQIGLNSERRWENLQDSFEVVKASSIASKKLLLVDDVFTTGATGFYAASKLISSGAKSVIVLTAAKSSI